MKTIFLMLVVLFFACNSSKKQSKSKAESPTTNNSVTEQNTNSVATPQAVEANTWIEMSKTACFGTCPVYTIKIDINGDAAYLGEQHVEKIGRFKKKFSSSETKRLFETFDNSNFWKFENKYIDGPTDFPTTYLTYNKEKQNKKIEDYYGGPQELKDLEKIVQEFANSDGWEKVD